jgi:nonribosomal peptide synthetase DhbF
LPLRPHGSGPVLFCIHPAGGLSWCYAGLMQHLGPEIPLYGLQAKGVTGEAAPAESLEAMAADYLAEIRIVQPSGPYHLLGWSFGGVVAHAIATRIQEDGGDVALLVSLDSTPLHQKTPFRLSESVRIAIWLETVVNNLPVPGQSSLNLDDVMILLDQESHPLAALTRPALAGLVDNFYHNVGLLHAHRPQKQFGGDLIHFIATQSRDMHPAGPDAWQPYIAGTIIAYEIDCNHHAMTLPSPLAQIGRTIANLFQRNRT